MRIVVGVNGLGLQTRDGIELLNGSSSETRQGTEDCALDFRNLSILHRIDQGVLSLRSVILQFFRCVLLAEWSDLVEVHFQIMRHLLRKIILRTSERGCESPCEEKQDGRACHRS